MASSTDRTKLWVERAGLVVALTVAMVSAVRAHGARPAAGTLDPRFGDGGVVRHAVDGFGFQTNGVAVDEQGRIVVASSAAQNMLDSSFVLTRYRSDGTLDPTFGDGNQVLSSFPGESANANALAIQPDGRIVVAGSLATENTARFALARYHGNGTLDAHFGAGGVVATDFGSGINFGYSVAIQHDGRIVVSGVVATPDQSRFLCGVARYERGGSLDQTFGSGGLAIADFGGFTQSCRSVKIQRDGRIIVGGMNKDRPGVFSFAVARFDRDGMLDQEFGTGGMTFAHFDGASDGRSLAIQPDGKIVLGGLALLGPNSPQIAGLARWDQHGVLDPTFGVGGLGVAQLPGTRFAEANAVAIDRVGRILVAGHADTPDGPGGFLLARYDSDGTPDASFGSGGAVLTTSVAGSASGLAILRDGDVVVAGTAGGIAVARYESGPECDRDFDW